MILKTELQKYEIEIDDAVFFMFDISTDELTDIALNSGGNKGIKLQDTFVAACKGWKNITDPNGIILTCNPDNKKIVFQANAAIMERLLTKYRLLSENLEEEEKKT